MANAGTAMLGVGCATGQERAEQAALAAVSAPLIQQSIERATGIVYNITGGRDMTLNEVNQVSQVVTSLADPSANVIFGAVVDDKYAGELSVTIIATGFSQSYEEQLFGGGSSRQREDTGRRSAVQAQQLTDAAAADVAAAPSKGVADKGASRLPINRGKVAGTFFGRGIF
eukprot:GHRR01028381.1.p2 GENE.GHRR01028381.1~~GHRR01028381.1.p2  ORF type:complete len:171 (+),score=76.17 GHRR01028381.1:357-869(+)